MMGIPLFVDNCENTMRLTINRGSDLRLGERRIEVGRYPRKLSE
jgi:hypothetical protein